MDSASTTTSVLNVRLNFSLTESPQPALPALTVSFQLLELHHALLVLWVVPHALMLILVKHARTDMASGTISVLLVLPSNFQLEAQISVLPVLPVNFQLQLPLLALLVPLAVLPALMLIPAKLVLQDMDSTALQTLANSVLHNNSQLEVQMLALLARTVNSPSLEQDNVLLVQQVA